MAYSDRSYGWQEELFATAESTFGAPVLPGATDAFKIISSAFPFAREREWRTDKEDNTRSHFTRVSGRKSGTFTIRKNLIPSGGISTAPDDHPLWKSAFGSGYNTATATEYRLESVTNQSLTFLRHVGNFGEVIYGAIVDTVRISGGGGQAAEVEFSGTYKDRGRTGNTTAAATTYGVTIEVQDGDAYKYSANGVITLLNGASTENATIESISGDATLVVASALSSTYHAGATITPYLPTATTTGTPVYGVIGTLEIENADVTLTDWEVVLANGNTLRNDEYGESSATDIVHGARRDVTFRGTAHLRDGYLNILGAAEAFVTRDVTLTIGDTAGEKVDVYIPYGEYNVLNPDVPEAEETSLAIEGVGRATSGDDEMWVRFY